MKEIKQRFITSSIILISLLGFLLLLSMPILIAGFSSDDAFSSLTLGETQLAHQSLFTYASQKFIFWLHIGRIFPVSIYAGYLFFYLFPSNLVYQIAHVIVIWLSLFSIAWLVRTVTEKSTPAILVLFLIPLCWSIRNYHDPLTSFAILLPLVVVFTSLTLIFFTYAIKTERVIWHLPAMICYALALNTYEISYCIFFAVFLYGLVQLSFTKRFIKNMIPYIVVSLVYFAIVAFLRYQLPQVGYNGIEVAKLSAAPHTLINQVIASVPLSYWMFAAKRYFPLSYFNPDYSIWLQLLPSVLVFLISLYPLNRLISQLSIDNKAIKSLIAIALPLIFIPALLVSISKKYQDSILFGFAYLPVYVEYIGFALLILCLINSLNRLTHNKVNLAFRYATVMLLCLIAGTSLFINIYTATFTNMFWQKPRDLVLQSLQDGLFATLPQGAVLYKNHDSWNKPAFYMQQKQISLDVIDLNNYATLDLTSHTRLDKNTYVIDYQSIDRSPYGYVLLAHLQSVKYKKINEHITLVEMKVTDPNVYIPNRLQHFLTFPGKPSDIAEIITRLNENMPLSPLVQKNLKQSSINDYQIIHLSGQYTLSWHMWNFDES